MWIYWTKKTFVKKFILTFILVTNLLLCHAQSKFEVLRRLDYDFLYKEDFGRVSGAREVIENYSIIFLEDQNLRNYRAYPRIPSSVTVEDTLGLIKELLSLQGDTRICALGMPKFDLRLSYDIEDLPHSNFSIQVGALLIINQLLYGKDWTEYSSFPVLKDLTTGETQSISGEIIDRAYESYFRWVEIAEQVGLKESLSPLNHPLQGSDIEWF